MPGRLYPPSRIEKKKKKLPFKDHFVSILEENPSRAHTHTAAVKKLGRPWRLVKAERLTGAAGGVGRKRSCCQSASAAIQGDHRLSQKTFQPLQLNATAFSGGQPRVSHGSHGPDSLGRSTPTPPRPPRHSRPPRWVICSWSRRSLLTAACLKVHPAREELEEEPSGKSRCLDALGVEMRAGRTTGTTSSGIKSGLSNSNM